MELNEWWESSSNEEIPKEPPHRGVKSQLKPQHVVKTHLMDGD